MMHDGMGSMMGWMMGIGLVGWVLVIALLVTIVILLIRLLSRRDQPQAGNAPQNTGNAPQNNRAERTGPP